MEKVGKTWFAVNSWDVSPRMFFANFDRSASHLIEKYEGKGGVEYEEFTALTKQQAQGDIGTTAIGNVLDKRVACAFIQCGNVRGLRPDPPRGGLTGKLLAAAEQVRVDGSGNLDVLNVAIHDGPLAVCAVVALFVWRPAPGVQPEYATSMPTPMSRSIRACCMRALLF